MYDIIIIGLGPAGISASLYGVRAGLKVLAIGKDFGALEKTSTVENYYGTKNISAKTLLENGIAGAKENGVDILQEEVVSLGFEESFTVTTTVSTHLAKTLIVATGVSRSSLKIKGAKEFEAKGISYCAVCDGFFVRKKDVAVVGHSSYALAEVNHLSNLAKTIVLLTDGKEPNVKFPENVKIYTQKIVEFYGDSNLQGAELADGTRIDLSGVFIAIGTAAGSDLAKKIGIATDKSKIIVDSEMKTNIPGIFAAGDAVGGMLQIVKAAYDGAVAASSCIKHIKGK